MTSKPLYVYLQRPDTGDWVTVGRYKLDGESEIGRFRYAPSYEAAGHAWTIDPVNLPYLPGRDWEARRYRGLHDVLRDACPDAWGKMLLQRQHNLPADAHDSRYLALAGNVDRWGALAVGPSATPSVAALSSPRLPMLEALSRELIALFERRPALDARLRQRLVATPSLGGARPKTTIQDADRYWLVKPFLPTDAADIPLLEHVAQQWGRACGLNFAETVHHALGDGLSVVRVLRFDRLGKRRFMAVSGASLLQTEYPFIGPEESARWSYPRLAEELKRIGAPLADRVELFDRMVFNAVAGNDDDHPRNHAAMYHAQENRWRLAPAFDVVPNPVEAPRALTMQLSMGRFDISREAALADAIRFGFKTLDEASAHLDALLDRIGAGFTRVEGLLSPELRDLLQPRLQDNLALLR
ncbi:serine/threonine-protein kinase HipA [Noviherbaspirillum humi]|uniref:Serine/threonine-protein kinase HipA n=1 Tax=Noviherbaspirillum humi TaxID=1688639 RepID=A0A239JQR4_9BURK|nr:HipA domain-containing protein [Noviherbaspirillum humi]SNT08386.1 serine/threonine-protein kinase HipA [Noviherbaspirillum humi]